MTALSAVLLPGLTAVAAGLIGAFALMRRMTLAGDALSHVALPGIGIALLLGINPVLGALAALLVGGTLIWGVERRVRLATETVTGVVFSAALAIGAMLTTGDELVSALFGSVAARSATEVALGTAGAIVVIGFVLLSRDRLVLTFLSADVAATAGVAVARLDYLYLMAFALTVALGLRYLGALLVGSLVIIPAATARQLARNLNEMLGMSAALAVVATLSGSTLAGLLHRESGPLIVAIAAICFFVALGARSLEAALVRPSSGVEGGLTHRPTSRSLPHRSDPG